jgi:hypothetical protein
MTEPATVRARIVDAFTDVSPRNGRPFIRLMLEPGGEAYCWREAIFEKVKLAAKAGGPVPLGLEPSQKTRRNGEPWTLVVSVG